MQLHLDLWFEDADRAEATAERLGAIRMPDERLAIYADPAGHFFCLLRPGQ